MKTTIKIESVKVRRILDERPDTIGIMAEAQVSYDLGDGCRRLETLTSGGLWGIESDSGDYIKEIEQEQVDDLRRHLARFGIKLNNHEIEYVNH